MKELPTETRVLVAFALSILVLILWSQLYKHQAPPKPPQGRAGAPVEIPVPTGTQAGQPARPSEVAAEPAGSPAPRAAAEEKSIVVESELYRVEFSNRGAVVRSWQLKKYTDDHSPPRTLDLVHPEAAAQLGGWPLSLALEDAQLESKVNSALFEVTPGGGAATFRAPVELRFEWSDGQTSVIKQVKFASSFVVEIESSVRVEGRRVAHALAWRGGFGDATAYHAAEQVKVFLRAQSGKLDSLEQKKLGQPNNREQRLRQIGTMEYVGIEDRYFAAAFLPRSTPSGGSEASVSAGLGSTSPGLALWHWKREREVVEEGKRAKEPVAEMAAGSTVAGPLALGLFVGPKDLDLLGRLTPPLTDLVQFGWFGFIATPLFYFLKWTYHSLPNYGWAIILMTVIINMLLFPLKVKSWHSMQKMQRAMPEIRSIQDRYKKYSMRDPRKQQMQQEVMAVYKREGINPMGGCLPMALQMPIWIALYQMLNAAIELRHAPWMLWIRDLSARDPYYILPILMAATMYLSQKMTPVTSPDPTQQRMMTLMPVFMFPMFAFVSSGLVLYILTSNVVGMAQQWYLNRQAPETARGGRGKKGRAAPG